MNKSSCPCCAFYFKMKPKNMDDLCEDCKLYFHNKIKIDGCECDLCIVDKEPDEK